ncbi:MAG: hypothetical protein ACR2MB_07675 [Acidimicrobiales bacterium]
MLEQARTRARRDRRQWPWRLGLVGIALLFSGSAWYQVWSAPPYRYIDEQAHVGYVLAIQSGHLPTIDTPIDQANGGVALRARLAIEPARRRDIWVANDPPLPYVLAAGPAAISRALGWSGGPLIGLRLFNATCMAAAVVFAARLGRGLAGGDQRVGLVAGGLLAALPHVGFIGGVGFTDGPALLGALAMLDALVSVCRLGPTRRQVALVGLWCALGASVRPMTAALAAAVAAMAFAVVAWRWVQARRRAQPLPATDDRRLSKRAEPVWSALVLAVPTLALSGWWYVRNIRLYGDATGSQRLFDKFLREPSGEQPVAILRHPSVWHQTLRTLFTRRLERPLASDPGWWWPWLKWGIVGALAATAVIVTVDQVLARRRRRASTGPGTEPRSTVHGWLGAYATIVVVVVLIAQHWSGGGAPHARYALTALGVLVAAMAFVVVRLGSRWAGVALIAVFVAIQARQVPLADKANSFQPDLLADSTLVAPYGPPWWRHGGIAAMAVGAAVLLVAVALVPRPGRPVQD